MHQADERQELPLGARPPDRDSRQPRPQSVQLDLGSRKTLATVSNSIPRKVSVDAGPSTLCIATGTPSSLHTANALSKLRAHSDPPGPAQHKKVVEVVETDGDASAKHGPQQGVRDGGEDLRRRPQAKRQRRVEVHCPFPANAEQTTVVRMHRNHTVRRSKVQLCEEATRPKQAHEVDCVVDTRIAKRAPTTIDPVVNAGCRRS